MIIPPATQNDRNFASWPVHPGRCTSCGSDRAWKPPARGEWRKHTAPYPHKVLTFLLRRTDWTCACGGRSAYCVTLDRRTVAEEPLHEQKPMF